MKNIKLSTMQSISIPIHPDHPHPLNLFSGSPMIKWYTWDIYYSFTVALHINLIVFVKEIKFLAKLSTEFDSGYIKVAAFTRWVASPNWLSIQFLMKVKSTSTSCHRRYFSPKYFDVCFNCHFESRRSVGCKSFKTQTGSLFIIDRWIRTCQGAQHVFTVDNALELLDKLVILKN